MFPRLTPTALALLVKVKDSETNVLDNQSKIGSICNSTTVNSGVVTTFASDALSCGLIETDQINLIGTDISDIIVTAGKTLPDEGLVNGQLFIKADDTTNPLKVYVAGTENSWEHAKLSSDA